MCKLTIWNVGIWHSLSDQIYRIMKHKTLFTIIPLIAFSINVSIAQSTIFSTKDEVVAYLEGEWNLDVIQGGFAGGTYYLPTPFYYDSSFHKIVFESTGIDSIPLNCKAFIDDTLYQETFVSISQNPSQIILPRWLLFNLPDNLENNGGLMEEYGFYGFSQDTTVIGGNIIVDGFEFGLTRLITGTEETILQEEIKIYPNPSSGNIYLEGIKPNTQFQLFAITGQLVKTDLLKGNFLNIENKGIYLLQLRVQDRWITRKIVVH